MSFWMMLTLCIINMNMQMLKAQFKMPGYAEARIPPHYNKVSNVTSDNFFRLACVLSILTFEQESEEPPHGHRFH